MTNEPLISVIIPFYNVEKYLSTCLDSVLAQTYDKLEIILINDGSTDSSGEIANQYLKHDERVKVYSQENRGISSARNSGLKHASGDYITFVDSDDFVEKDYVEYLFNLIKKTGFKVKLSICSLMNIYSYTGYREDCGDGSEKVLSGKECIKKMCYNDMVDTCCYAKLASKDLYDSLEFPEGDLFEDMGTTYLLFYQCDYVSCGFKSKYNYFIRKNSIVTSEFNKHKLDLLKMTDKMAEFVGTHFPDLKGAALRRQMWARFSTLNQTISVTGNELLNHERKDMIRFIRGNSKQLLSDGDVPRRDKVGCFMLLFGFKPYKLAWKAYLKLNKKR